MNLSNNPPPNIDTVDEIILGSILSRKSYPNSIQRHLPSNNRWKDRYFVIKKSEILSIISSGKKDMYIYTILYVYGYVFMHIHVCLYECSYIYVYMFVDICMDIHIYTYIIFRYTIEFEHQ
jgi:hypothetical protein